MGLVYILITCLACFDVGYMKWILYCTTRPRFLERISKRVK